VAAGQLGGFYDRIIATWLNRTKNPSWRLSRFVGSHPLRVSSQVGKSSLATEPGGAGFQARSSRKSGIEAIRSDGMDDIAEQFDRLAARAENDI
jgi:hypothetical protein